MRAPAPITFLIICSALAACGEDPATSASASGSATNITTASPTDPSTGGTSSPTTGEVIYKGNRISGLPPHKVARMGVVRTFQETTIFRSMTVRENVIVAHHLRSRATLLGFFFGSRQARSDEEEFGKSADDIIDFLGLQAIRNELASNLPQGHLRALGMAIGLATNPTVLLLALWHRTAPDDPRLRCAPGRADVVRRFLSGPLTA